MRKRKKLLSGCLAQTSGWVVVLVGKRERNRHGGEGLHEVEGLGKFFVAGEWPHGTIEKVLASL